MHHQQQLHRCCLLLAGVSLLLLFVAFVDVVQPASIYSPDFNDSSAHFLAQQRSCRDLCSFCPTCNGFYCGEECICECSQDPSEHAKCIDLIRANSEKLGLVYDLFIQMPQKRSTRARFGRRVKSSEQIDDNATAGADGGFRKILFSNFASKRTPEQQQQQQHLIDPITTMNNQDEASIIGKERLEKMSTLQELPFEADRA
ncbi:uncharacterized protein LOC126576882 [Anopheles aquasalis]|uniref:uncharacterized protein LOC126576882 n=1 Tax=Anopheles aquasalis TaxID=42839 RepID=UPI00215AF4AB|nr:uncharacterized protein LOC126576882 [Anopheles aquasalis]